jgi:hypothetical protein
LQIGRDMLDDLRVSACKNPAAPRSDAFVLRTQTSYAIALPTSWGRN